MVYKLDPCAVLMLLGVFCGVDKFAIKIDFIASNQGDIKKI